MTVNFMQTTPNLTPPTTCLPCVYESSGGVYDSYPNPMVVDSGKWAGARVIQMIEHQLGKLDGSGALQLPPVGAVYDAAHLANDPAEPLDLWYIDPKGMHDTLANYDPRGPNNWAHYEKTNQDEANGQIYDTLTTYNVTAAVLVSSGRHWVCVKGWGIDDTTNKLAGFWVTDPADGGPADQQPQIPGMWNTWFTPVSGAGSRWDKKYVEIGDPRPAKETVQVQPRPIKLPGDRIITPEEAVRFAREGISEMMVPTEAFERLGKGAKPLEPRLVSHLDREDTYYYIVPFLFDDTKTKDQVHGAVLVDARFGDVLNVSASEEAFSLLGVSAKDARNRLLAGRLPVYEPISRAAARLLFELQEHESATRLQEVRRAMRSPVDTVAAALALARQPLGSLTVRAESLYIHPVLGWMPCLGTPFHPVHIAITPFHTFYVSTFNAHIWSSLEFCDWGRLGG